MTTEPTKRRGRRSAGKFVEILEDRRLLSASLAAIAQPAPLPQPVPPVGGGQSAASASSLAAGSDGNLWFTDQNNNAIGRQTPAGAVTEFGLPTDQAWPDQITAGPDGNLWFIETGVSQIARITTAGKVSEFAMPSTDSSPSAITSGPGGALWFVDSGTNEVGRITTSGKISEFSFDSTNLMLIGGITGGPDGNVWAAAEDDSGNGALARVTPAGKISSFPLPAYPNDLTVGPDKNLWVASDGEIDRVTTAGVATSFALPNGDGAFGITSGPDGALWFGTYGANSLGRMTTAGSTVEFNPPSVGQYGFVNGLTSGPDQQIWYATDSGTGNPVLSLNPTNALLAGGLNATATAGSTSTVTVASFVDLAPGASASFYHATIDWGDGTTSDGVIAANNNGGFDVSGTHTWGIGSSDITVTITDVRAAADDPGGLAGRTATAYATVTSPAPPTQGTGVDVNATAGQLFSGVVAHYTGVILTSLSSYSANIDWGDGHYTSGTIAADGQGGVSISGSNRYEHSGSYTVTTNLWPWSFGPIVPIAASGGGIAARGRVVGVPVKAVTVSSGGSSSGGPIASPPIMPVPEPPIPLPDPNGTTSTAIVAPGVMDGTGYSLLASSKVPFENIVASFKLTDPNADLSHFHATVKWNDFGTFDWFTLSTPDITNATITPDGQGNFTVSVNTTLAQYGWYHYQVLISDDRLPSGDGSIVGAAYGQVIVDTPIRPLPIYSGVIANGAGAVKTPTTSSAPTPPNPALSEHVKFSAVPIKRPASHAFSGDLGVLTGIVSGASNASALQGTINWGDGTSSAAQFVRGHKGKIHVRGAHTYAAAGNDKITLSLTQALSSTGASSSGPPIHLQLAQTTARITSGRARHHRRR